MADTPKPCLVDKHGNRMLIQTDATNIIYNEDQGLSYGKYLEDTYLKVKYLLEEEYPQNGLKVINSHLYDKTKEYEKHTLVRDKIGIVYLSKDKKYEHETTDAFEFSSKFMMISKVRPNMCIMRVNVEGDYDNYVESRYEPDELSNYLAQGYIENYAQNGDWIEVFTKTLKYTFIVNLNTYMHTFTDVANQRRFPKITCIDLICNKIELRNPNDTPVDLPWNAINDFFNLNLQDNDKIPEHGDMPIILGNYATKIWDNYIMSLLEDPVSGFNSSFTRHIVDKYKKVPFRMVDKKSKQVDLNANDDGIYYDYNNSTSLVSLGKAWLLYEGEIYGYDYAGSKCDAMACEQYPMFRMVENRSFNYCGKKIPTITSSLYKNTSFKPICIDTHNNTIPTDDIVVQPNMMHPIFGIRFV